MYLKSSKAHFNEVVPVLFLPIQKYFVLTDTLNRFICLESALTFFLFDILSLFYTPDNKGLPISLLLVTRYKIMDTNCTIFSFSKFLRFCLAVVVIETNILVSIKFVWKYLVIYRTLSKNYMKR